MPITSVVNNAFKTNTLPVDMKKAEISPMFKRKDHMLKTYRPENYRPVNSITVFSKIIESIN